ncbi:MAG: DUF523 domain-containing protein [Clostridiales bacterium]|nr:DUF523 domain-containing protein [Clostridiales bacterium]
MKILVSACLLGVCCRYDGKSKPSDSIIALAKDHQLIPVCPEQLGGLATPRPPAERQGDEIRRQDGGDVTKEYQKGAYEAARLYDLFDCDCAILKSRSPSCGSGVIYDGSFTGSFREGDGVTAQLLKEKGIPVFSDEEEEKYLAYLKK